MKTSKSATLGEKLSKYLIVKPIILSKYKLGLGTQSLTIDMKEFSKYNKGYNYLLNVIDIFSKYAWSIPLKTKTGLEVTNLKLY